VNQAENLNLALTFSESELSEIVKEMKSDTAPGPNGFPVAFFQKCWPLVKHGVLSHLERFHPWEDWHRSAQLWGVVSDSQSPWR
jgi:hypothetical protein